MPLFCASILFPLQCIPCLLLGSTTLNRATGTEVCSAELCIRDRGRSKAQRAEQEAAS